METILEVKDLRIAFDTDHGRLRAVDGVNFKLHKGKTLGIVGESGCGKSVTCLSLIRLLPQPAGVIESGQVLFNGQDLLKLTTSEIYKIRGNRIAMIFQEPMTALNPVQKIGRQMAEVYRLHFPNLSDQEIIQKSVELLEKVGIPSPDRRLNEFPHQLSGGMRQRVMIAIALACKPDILIADEPTTALDVTIQAQILELMQQLKEDMGMSIIFITHDLGVVAEVCDEVAVMYAGKVVESAEVIRLFEHPKHPYTRGLLNSIPRLENPRKSILNTIEGMVPPLSRMPSGCRFENRCQWSDDHCRKDPPPKDKVIDEHFVSCFKWKKINEEGQK